MDKPIFSRKIKCKHCGGNFKSKKERNTRKYICSNYDNYGKCVRIPIEEDFLKELITKRFQKEMSNEEMSEIVDEIIIEDKLLFEIHFKNSDKPIIFSEKYIQY